MIPLAIRFIAAAALGGMVSFDKGRKQFVFRQFHVEGFVNHYVGTISEDAKTIVFLSEGSRTFRMVGERGKRTK